MERLDLSIKMVGEVEHIMAVVRNSSINMNYKNMGDK